MSTKAYVVLKFGNTVIHLYRHWGGDPEITGMDILEKLETATRLKERAHFHDGGYVLRQMLSESDGSLPQYQVVDGTIGMGWDHGYEIISDGAYDNPGPWVIWYARLDGTEVLDDWIHGASVFTISEFADFVQREIDSGLRNGKTYDVQMRAEWIKRHSPPTG